MDRSCLCLCLPRHSPRQLRLLATSSSCWHTHTGHHGICSKSWPQADVQLLQGHTVRSAHGYLYMWYIGHVCHVMHVARVKYLWYVSYVPYVLTLSPSHPPPTHTHTYTYTHTHTHTRRFEQDEQEQMICSICGTIAQDFLSQSQDVDDGGFGGAIASSNAKGMLCVCMCVCVCVYIYIYV